MRMFHTGVWTTSDDYAHSLGRNHVMLAQYRRSVEELRLRIADLG